jgi:hypothetical protein
LSNSMALVPCFFLPGTIFSGVIMRQDSKWTFRNWNGQAGGIVQRRALTSVCKAQCLIPGTGKKGKKMIFITLFLSKYKVREEYWHQNFLYKIERIHILSNIILLKNTCYYSIYKIKVEMLL